jgi:hypothetical protein
LFSAALLVKRSANQLNRFYRKSLRNNEDVPKVFTEGFEAIPTEKQLEGNRQAEAKAVSPFIEMQGCFEHRDLKIYFSADEVIVKPRWYTLIEHKWLDPEKYERQRFESSKKVADWFFKQALIQTAFIRALTKYSPSLATAGYYKGPRHELQIPTRFSSRLCFGDIIYSVTCDELKVMQFYLTKARAVRQYERAIRFDAKYKHNEWEYFKESISYRKRKSY